jgi:DTW domain-containing protein
MLSITSHRVRCSKCRKPEATCYCQMILPFASNPVFAILIHKAETRRSIATGRMAHLCLSNSYMFEGVDFTAHDGVNALIEDPGNYCVVLSPGKNSINLSSISNRNGIFPESRQLVVFVIDGTWSQAKRMRRLSENIKQLPSICFTPKTPSKFLVRKQPASHCYSTIEAIHECISLISKASQPHRNLLTAFDYMVTQQVGYVDLFAPAKQFRSTRGKRERVS